MKSVGTSIWMELKTVLTSESEFFYGGGERIRTPGKFNPTTVFKTASLNQTRTPLQRQNFKHIHQICFDSVILYHKEKKFLENFKLFKERFLIKLSHLETINKRFFSGFALVSQF